MIRKSSYEIPAVFQMLAAEGSVDEHMMYNTYNMGIGMVIAAAAEDADRAVKVLREAGETVWCIGEVRSGEKGVELV